MRRTPRLPREAGRSARWDAVAHRLRGGFLPSIAARFPFPVKVRKRMAWAVSARTVASHHRLRPAYPPSPRSIPSVHGLHRGRPFAGLPLANTREELGAHGFFAAVTYGLPLAATRTASALRGVPSVHGLGDGRPRCGFLPPVAARAASATPWRSIRTCPGWRSHARRTSSRQHPARSRERMDSSWRSPTGSPLAAARTASALRPARGRKRMARVTAARAAASFLRLRPAQPPLPPGVPSVHALGSGHPLALLPSRQHPTKGREWLGQRLPARPGRASMCRAATAANRRLFGNEVPQHKS